MSHTTRPWKAGDGIILPEWPSGVSEIADGSGYVVAFVPLHRGSSRNDERETWPSLIAAAPELLEALKQIADKGAWQEHIDQARAAIAKATGGAR